MISGVGFGGRSSHFLEFFLHNSQLRCLNDALHCWVCNCHRELNTFKNDVSHFKVSLLKQTQICHKWETHKLQFKSTFCSHFALLTNCFQLPILLARLLSWCESTLISILLPNMCRHVHWTLWQNTLWKLKTCVSSSIVLFESCVFHMDAHWLFSLRPLLLFKVLFFRHHKFHVHFLIHFSSCATARCIYISDTLPLCAMCHNTLHLQRVCNVQCLYQFLMCDVSSN